VSWLWIWFGDDILHVLSWFVWIPESVMCLYHVRWFRAHVICMIGLRVFLGGSSLFLVDLNVFLMITKWVVQLCFLVSWWTSDVFYWDLDDFLLMLCLFLIMWVDVWICYMYDWVLGVCLCAPVCFLLTWRCSWWLLNELSDRVFSGMKDVLCVLLWFGFLSELLVLVSSSEF
jgi:hypothetical protein